MKNETKSQGRPVIKPKRKQTTFMINEHFIDKLQLLQTKRFGQSMNDIYNEGLEMLLKSNKII